MDSLRFRQVHLDFHTSEHIAGIGGAFDPDEFAETLKAAHVNSVTCFSRCHHGWIYHDTEKLPERRHPHLMRNLLKDQIEACHKRDIRVPIYTSVQWDLYTAKRHPEWLIVDENGCHPGTKPFEAGFYCRFCLNTPYVNFLEAQTVEFCEMFDVDGVFFDIVAATPCSCPKCIDDMVTKGLEPSCPIQRQQFADQVLLRFKERMSKVVLSRHPEATVFFNGGHVGPRNQSTVHTYTHLELESLPSGGWGYMHFPQTQRYARNLGVDTLGMTGKFHTSWGDFQSFKNPAALEFECLNMLALGAKCSIGDQLHPTGRICKDTYNLIGGVYEKVEAAEPWCVGARPVVDIGVFTPEEFAPPDTRQSPPAVGAVRMLQELHHQFDVIDSQSDLGRYKVLILPDEIPLNPELAEKLRAYVTLGGALLASYRSGLNPEGTEFSLRELGVRFKGPAEFSPDFIVPGKLGNGLRDTAYVMYDRGLEVEATRGAEVLSSMQKPYFNRTHRHFCSHKHAPVEGAADYPGAVRNGRCVYFMHPLFSTYHRLAPFWCKKLVGNALDLVLPEPVVRVDGPSTLIAAVNEQPDEKRIVLHLLHYVPERRGQEFDTIEEVIPLSNVTVSLRATGSISAVTLAPQNEPLDFKKTSGRVEFTVPRIEGHKVVSIRVQ